MGTAPAVNILEEVGVESLCPWQCLDVLAANRGMAPVQGGTLILVSACPEGIGCHPMLADYCAMDVATLLDDVRAKRLKDRNAGGQAVLFNRLKQAYSIALVSDGISDEMATAMGMRKYPALQAAVAVELQRVASRGCPTRGQVAVLHEASVAMPYIA
eukprot:scaffold479_cov376-Prasinococcus_capsulatus_cf.AAC.3